MDQDTPMKNSGFGTTSGSDTGSTTGRTGSTGSMSGSGNLGSSGSMGGSGSMGSMSGSGSMGSMGDTGTTGRAGSTGSMGNTGLTSSGTETCASCGQTIGQNRGLEQFLGRLGINEEMITNIKNSMQNVDVEEYLTTARDYLKSNGGKATNYAKENPGKVAAGVAVLAVGAGLLISAMNKD